MKSVLELREELSDLQSTAKTIVGDKGNYVDENVLADEKIQELEDITQDIESRKQTIEIRERTELLTADDNVSTRRTQPQKPANPSITNMTLDGGNFNSVEYNEWDFKADYLKAVIGAGTSRNNLNVQSAATTFSTTYNGADGGYAVAPQFSNKIVQTVIGEDPLLSRCTRQPTSGNDLDYPLDEDTPWNNSSGVTVNWEGEGSSYTGSKVNLNNQKLYLNKLVGFVKLTDELIEDSVALSAYVDRKVKEKLSFKLNLAILQGTGSGQPLGLLNAPATISIAKEGSQAADTLLFENIINMWSRCYAESRKNSVWLINQDIEPQMFQMKFSGSLSDVPVYMPANGISGNPYSTLMGKDVVPTQACETLGDKGDIMLANLKDYMILEKPGGVRSDSSIHFHFDQSITCLRVIMRVGGHPLWSQAASPRDGANTLSPFVTLDERA